MAAAAAGFDLHDEQKLREALEALIHKANAAACNAADRAHFQAALLCEVARSRVELAALEWSADIDREAGGTEPGCPRCGGPKRIGHEAGCRLGAIVREAC
jgi:hypothetical protein